MIYESSMRIKRTGRLSDVTVAVEYEYEFSEEAVVWALSPSGCRRDSECQPEWSPDYGRAYARSTRRRVARQARSPDERAEPCWHTRPYLTG
jgi:hypothetical protein